MGLGKKWVLVQEVCEGGYFGALIAVRVKQVSSVSRGRGFADRFARTRPEWPPRAPGDVDLDSTARMIQKLSEWFPLVGIEQEVRYPHGQWIGTVWDVRRGWLALHEVRPDASWRKRPWGYRLKRITKIVVGDRYHLALHEVAGRGPSAAPFVAPGNGQWTDGGPRDAVAGTRLGSVAEPDPARDLGSA